MTTLVVVLKPNCGGCDIYKAHQHRKLYELLRQDMRVTMLVYQIPSNTVEGVNRLELVRDYCLSRGPLPSEPHPDLLNVYWKWWPMMLLFNTAKLNNHDSDLEGSVYCGTVVDIKIAGETVRKIVENNEQTYDPTAENIFTWIAEILESEKRGAVSPTYHEFIANQRRGLPLSY